MNRVHGTPAPSPWRGLLVFAIAAVVPAALAAGAGATPDSPVADSPCTLASAVTANPAVLLLGETTVVRLGAVPRCPSAALHIVMAIDTSSSMAGDKINGVKGAVTTLISRLELPTHPNVQAGVVGFGMEARTVIGLTNDENATIAAVKQLRAFDGAATDKGILGALALLLEGRKPAGAAPDVEEVILLFTDSQAPADLCQRMVSAAHQAISEGVTMAAVCVQDASCEDCLPQLVSSRRWYFQIADVSSMTGAVVGLRDRLGQPALARLRVVELLPANMRLVPGSAAPAPKSVDEVAGRVVWDTDTIPTTGVTFTVGVSPLQPGQWPALRDVSLSFSDDRLRDGVGPPPAIPRVVVLRPDVLASPTSAATTTPTSPPTATRTSTSTPPPASPTPTRPATRAPTPAYLPLTLREQCVPEQRHTDVALVLDASTSMLEPVATGGTKLDAARAAAGTFLDSLRFDVGDQAALVAFNDEAVVLQTLTADRMLLTAAFGRVTARLGTRIHLGIDAAAGELLGARHRAGNVPVLVLLTDGRSNPEPAEVAVERAAAAKAAGVTIFAIGLGNELDFDALARIASRPEYFYYAPDAAELAGIYAAIAETVPCPKEAFWGGR